MTAALELAALVGTEPVDAALGVAAAAGRFAEGDLLAIVEHQAAGDSIAALVVPDEEHSASPAPAPGPPSAPDPTSIPSAKKRCSDGHPHHRHRDSDDASDDASDGAAPALPEELLAVLKRMRLPYLRNAAPEVLATARAQRWDPAEVLRVLIAEEIRGRDEATRRMRRKTAGLRPGRRLSPGAKRTPSIPPGTQTGLATLEWVGRAGEPGHRRTIRHREDPLHRSGRAQGHRRRHASLLVHLETSPPRSAKPPWTGPSPRPSPGSPAPSSS